jgi:putative lipoic acid-binding regulatory protein
VAENGSPFEFPCEIPVKVFGRNDAAFREAVLNIVRTYYLDYNDSEMAERLSRKDRYVCLTITVWTETRAQIDALYTELTAHDAILMVL